MSAFAKAKITGTGAAEFLDRLIANRIPKKAGRVNLCHALSYGGGVHSEYTIIKESDTSFYVVSAGALQSVDHDWIRKHMPEDGSVQFTNVTNAMGVLVIAGPKARTLMERVSPRTDFSNAAFPWLSSRWIDAGHAPTLAARVNYVGELGWELHHPIEYQNHIFDRLMEAGADLGIKPFGIRAMDTMRMEKSYRMMGTELSIEYAALEAKLDRFVHLNKGDFIGRDALVKWQEKGFANELVTMRIDGVEDADVLGGNPLFHNGDMVGRATSGNYGFRVGQSLALAMVPPSLAAIGTKFTIDILGKRFDAQIIEESPFDPDNEKLRA
jgi:dimethylglycine dehydrogenase